jgi:2-polyprenyl-3-methyl-5-hydroxy-6-metoxy-1,4-benzoquinol methylase
MSKSVDLLQSQIEYYRERASEYDQWFFRQGRYDRGEAHRQQWFAEVAEVEEFLRATQPSGNILELACGTGLWTEHLASLATHVTAVDASPEVIALNQTRVNSESVEYIIADLFNWTPTQKFDLVFFGFWLSHVPMDRFADFWQMVKNTLKPNGRAFFVDSLFDRTSPAINHAALHQDGYSERKLNDGRVYQIVKIFHEPTQLEKSLQNFGWSGRIHSTPTHFIYGSICPRNPQF